LFILGSVLLLTLWYRLNRKQESLNSVRWQTWWYFRAPWTTVVN